jgi:hypothetical protein
VDYQVPWAEFCDAFHAYYITASVMMKKCQEFMDLKQGGRSVHGYSKSEEEHAQHLRVILQWLWDHELYAKFSKCAFYLKEFPFLWHVISAEGIAVDPSKVQEVLGWKSPKSVMQIRSFLGLAEYYCRFIPNFSKIAKPMTQLLEKEAKFK